MKFIHRLGYYLGGFAIGLIVLAFFLSGKRTSCDYGPNARTVKNILSKKLILGSDIKESMMDIGMDSLQLSSVLKVGTVNFSESDTKRDSCNLYVIESIFQEQPLTITLENCSTTANIKSVQR